MHTHCARLLSCVALLLVFLVPHIPSAVSAAPVQVKVDNSIANSAIQGEVIDPDPNHAMVAVKNLHDFWTNITLWPPSGSVKLKPANPLHGGREIGGAYAALGVLGPGSEAVWVGTFDTRLPSSEQVFATPSLQGGSLLAGDLNVLTFLLAIAGVSPVLQADKTAQTVLRAASIAAKSADFTDCVAALENQDVFGFAEHFYSMLSDPQQAALLASAIAALTGLLLDPTTLGRLVEVITVIQLAGMAFDEFRALLTQTQAGSVSFQTQPPLPGRPRSKTAPGGTWISPADGQVTGDTLQFSAHAFPARASDPPISHVNFTLWWPALGPPHGHWQIGCVATPPPSGDVYSCSADLPQLHVPPGDFSASFDVYDAANNANLAPSGVHSAFYLPSGPCAETLGQHCAAVWTDQSQYEPGDPFQTCFSVPAATRVHIIDQLPDGSNEDIVNGKNDGSGGCQQSNLRKLAGPRHLHMDVYSLSTGKLVATADDTFDVVSATPSPTATATSQSSQEALTLGQTQGPAGSNITATWTDDADNTDVTVTVTFDDQQIATFQVAGDDNWTGQIAIPRDATPGSHTITFQDDDNSSRSATFDVTGP